MCQGGREHTLTHQVEVACVFHYRTADHIAQAFAVQVEAVHQALQRSGEHVLVGGGGVDRIGAGERNTVTTQNGNTADGLCHGKSCKK